MNKLNSNGVIVIFTESESKEEETRYSIPSKHIFTASMKPLSKPTRTFVKDDDCAFCSMFGESKCCLHHEDSGKEPRLTYRNAVEGGMPLQYEGLVFKAGPSSRSDRLVLFVEGEVDVIKSK